MAYGLMTYDDAARREDLIDLIADVSPDENPLTTLLGTTKASGTWHEWLEEYISRPTSVSKTAEGGAATYSDLTQPSRRGNFCQIVSQTFRVSGTERAVSVAGMADPYDYQAAKALRQLKNNMEYAILRGTYASGSSGIAREMIGITAVTTSHGTALSSGCSLSETLFNNFVQDVWTDVGSEHVFDTVLVPFGLRRKISTFTAENTRYQEFEGRLNRSVMEYESDGGVHRIFAHKDVNNSAGTVHFLGIREDLWKIAYLRPPFRKDLAVDGDRDNGMWITELSLEYRAQRSGIRSTGFNQNG